MGDSPIFSISVGTSSLEQELRAPNAQDGDIANIVSLINGDDAWAPAHSNPIGFLVGPGCIRVAEVSGKMYAVGPGRWVLKQRYKLAGYASWTRDGPVNLTSTNRLQCGPLTICRVGPNEIGLA